MVERDLAGSQDEAQRLIMAGEVSTQGRRIDKPSEMIEPDAALSVKVSRRFVSRGGEKLDAALGELGVDVRGRDCVDVGCATGGFTDCLLSRGARHVVAIDVGYGEFAWRLRNDERVHLLERTNFRDVDVASLPTEPDLLVADLSFIGLSPSMPALLALVPHGGDAILLVKPQFELPREDVGDGVVRDPELHERAVRMVEDAAEQAGARVAGRAVSPLMGADGNREFFLRLEIVRS
jgi:23S rRNA (cytidine1920-2'-O)/16S rRNA (cytidine1409-2'-O)-methyltransferase